MAITKAMLARCQNELKQAFCALPEDVQKAIASNSLYLQRLFGDGKWLGHVCSWELISNEIFRLSPDTPTEPEWEDAPVVWDSWNRATVNRTSSKFVFTVNECVMIRDFIGIIYLKDGIETLRTSVDAAFGTPVRVRFTK